MNRSIVLAELRINRTYTIVWCLVLAFTTGANIAGSASMLRAAPAYDILLAVAQGASNTVMAGAIFSMILGGLVISREEDEKTIEFLLSHPVTRLEIALSKALAFAILNVVLLTVLLVTCWVFVELFKSSAGYDAAVLVGIWVSQVVLIFFYGAAGMLFSAFVTKGGAVVGACIGIPMVTMILALLGSVDNTLLRLLSYLSPVRYLDIAAVMARRGPQPGFVAIFVGIAAAFLAISFARYTRKEFAV